MPAGRGREGSFLEKTDFGAILLPFGRLRSRASAPEREELKVKRLCDILKYTKLYKITPTIWRSE